MKKILIVDDQIEVRELVEVTLRYGNFKILQASNGLDAIAIVKKRKIGACDHRYKVIFKQRHAKLSCLQKKAKILIKKKLLS